MTRAVRCCLVQLYSDLQPANADPLAIEALAGAITRRLPGATPTLLTFGVHHTPTERAGMLARLTSGEFDLIGISCPQGTLDDALLLLGALFTLASPPLVVIGHALPTSLPDYFLERFPQALIVRGWGEDAIVALCREATRDEPDLTLVPSLTWRDASGERHDTPLRTALVGVPLRLDPASYFCRIEASRGCHYDICTFCARFPRLKHTAAWKRLSLEQVIAQAREIAAAGASAFTFTDEDFIGDDLAGALALGETLRAIPGLDFTISVRVDSVIDRSAGATLSVDHAALFAALRAAGLSMVFMGAESFSASQLRRYGKGVSPEENIAAVRALEGYGLDIELGLIMFDPLVTLAELRENVDTLLRTGLYRYVGYPFSFMRAQVNTPYATLLEHRGLLGDLNPNLAAYDARYASAVVAEVAERCQAFFQTMNRFYAALRNVYRSSPAEARMYRGALDEARLIQVEYLAALLRLAESAGAHGWSNLALWRARLGRCRAEVAARIQAAGQVSPAEAVLLAAAVDGPTTAEVVGQGAFPR
ncbi:MAG: radical SAM protein [Chloroflexota bacterium]|nr:radical SAM protein [Chloroflexota bacterium]